MCSELIDVVCVVVYYMKYVTSIIGNSHQWTSDGASSVYSPTSDSFRMYSKYFDDRPNA